MAISSAKQVTELSVSISNVPGSLAKVTTALADAGVNLEGVSQITETTDQMGGVRFVTSQVDVAKQVLGSLGINFKEEKIIAVDFTDMPGVLAKVATALGKVNVNIEDLYFSTPGGSQPTVMFVEVHDDDLAKATEALQQLSNS